ncbi:MAG: succinate dehydrogenase assembly factor 2 [Alphaproteobacteria bacterium]
MTETRETRIKRLAMRSWRRGIQEMDLILGSFADAELAGLDGATLDAYERLLEENDWDLYYWVTGAQEAPATHVPLIGRLATFHKIG